MRQQPKKKLAQLADEKIIQHIFRLCRLDLKMDEKEMKKKKKS